MVNKTTKTETKTNSDSLRNTKDTKEEPEGVDLKAMQARPESFDCDGTGEDQTTYFPYR